MIYYSWPPITMPLCWIWEAVLKNQFNCWRKRAARAFVICTDEPAALSDAYAFIKRLLETAPQTDIRVIVNSADSEKEGLRTFETLQKTCAHFLHFQPVLQGIIRRDTHVKEAVRAQQALLNLFPDTPAASDIRKLLEK